MSKQMARHKTAATGDEGPRTLAIDVGGTGLKCSILDAAGAMIHDKVWRATPHPCTPEILIETLEDMVKALPAFDRISLGFPGAVRGGRVITAPHFPEGAWPGLDLAALLGRAFAAPARVLNDAEVQGLGVIAGEGLEFVLTLGTGAGTAIFQDGHLTPHLELAHHPIHGKKDYNHYVGRDALKKAGKKRWNKRVSKVIAILEALIHYDRIYIGGGNAREVELELPENARIVSNDAGITGGVALWKDGVMRPGAAA